MNDDELLARLKATDPALTSKAPRPDVTRLMEATMNTPNTATAPQPPPRARRRAPASYRRWRSRHCCWWDGGAITWGVTRGGEGPAEKTAPPAATAGPHPQPGP